MLMPSSFFFTRWKWCVNTATLPPADPAMAADEGGAGRREVLASCCLQPCDTRDWMVFGKLHSPLLVLAVLSALSGNH